MATTATKSTQASAGSTVKAKASDAGTPSDFWFERSQAYSAATELARRVLEGIDDDGGSGSEFRQAALQLVAVVAGAVSTARDQLVVRLQEAYDRANATAGLFVLHADVAQMSADQQRGYRENLSAIAGLLFGLRRSITQDR